LSLFKAILVQLQRKPIKFLDRAPGGFQMTNDARVAGMPEGEVTELIESQTSQIPSSAYLGAAIGSMALAAVLKAAGKDQWAIFVGQWAAPFLLLGVYNKMVKQHGSDSESRKHTENATLSPT
jgi:hypothetical protein